MPGTYTFKPIEANLIQNTSHSSKMNPLCSFIVGENRVQTQACPKGGKHPHWTDTITLPISDDVSSKVHVIVKDQGKTSEEEIGSFDFNLEEVQKAGHVSKWYPIYDKKKYAGEVLMEARFQPDPLSMYFANVVQDEFVPKKEEQEVQKEKEDVKMSKKEPTTVVQLQHQEPAAVFTEQKQVIEPHTFVKQVDSVEMRTHTQEIEVMKPVKVIKEVPETETVHVKKLVEVTKPVVVTKEVEVMEPKLVTKTIQVVEDVPVKRKVEVIEYRTEMEEVDTVEPQTVMKPVEVTEYVPVKKEVQVTEPVTVKKEVEYVEPVVTTKTAIKKVPEAVVVEEMVNHTVGPATILDTREDKVMETKLLKEEIRVPVKEEKVKETIVTGNIVNDASVVGEKLGGQVGSGKTVKTEKVSSKRVL